MPTFRALGNAISAPPRKLIAGIAWMASKLYEGIEWLYHLRVELWRVEGEERHSGLPLSVLCGLRGNTKNYLLGQLFKDGYRQRSLGRFWLWNLSKPLPRAASDCSLIFLWACNSHLKKLTRPGEWFLIPDCVSGTVDLPRDAIATRKVQGDLQKIRRHGLQCEVTRDRRKFDDFYYNMYVPYISKTYGDCAFITPYKQLRRVFQTCDLLLVEKEHRSVAGQLITYQEAIPRLMMMGIRNGDREVVRTGGGGPALFHFSLQYLQEKGYCKAELGWSRPFLHDGVLIHKRRWSQVITESYDWGFWLKILSLEPASRSLLRNNPFIHKRNGLLYAAVFVDSDTAITSQLVDQLMKDYFHAGLKGLDIYRLLQENTTEAKPVEVELPEHIKVQRIDQG